VRETVRRPSSVARALPIARRAVDNQPMTNAVSFTSPKGRPTSGHLAIPEGVAAVGAVVLIHEWWGLNDHTRDLSGRLAKAGFLVLAVDLYDGRATADPGEAAKLMTALDTHDAVDRVAGAAAWLRAHPRSNGKVGVTGFCMGGAMSFAAACHVPGLAAVAPFYGVPNRDKVDYTKVTAPIQAHFAKNDEWASVAKAAAIRDELRERGREMDLCEYDAGHAFVNDTRPEAYHAPSATLAWERMVAFFHQHLA
jgi:carboxymethylenebutenolidase